jgi:uncharacterized NAD(P)/FAD-binding protein YdhS
VSEFDCAIVGGGFSGCAVAANIARRAEPSFALAICEPDELGRGAAYGTAHSEHLLNTRAQAMSLFADDRDHFVRWLGARGGPADFVSRRLYGDYVGETALTTLERVRFTHFRERVTAVRREADAFAVEFAWGAPLRARTVVLATGNPPPAGDFLPAEVRAHSGYVADPWRFDFRVVGGHVLLIGSGLTALDALVALRSSGHRGMVHVLSRRGRFPGTHADVAPYDVIPALDTHDARALLRSFRRHVRDAMARGFDWRAVVDALRPEAEAIWRRLPALEQLRFERHLRTHWERHRHRAPQQVDAVRDELARANRMRTYVGRLRDMRCGRVTVALRDGGVAELYPDWIINCTGLGREPAHLGYWADADLSAVDRRGSAVPGMWVTGPPARGVRFEATAVPELRGMAESVAFEVLRTRLLSSRAS